MNWTRKDRYAEVSACGQYSVCAIGTGKGYTFEGWRTRAHKEGLGLVCHNVTAAEARKACEADQQEGER